MFALLWLVAAGCWGDCLTGYGDSTQRSQGYALAEARSDAGQSLREQCNARGGTLLGNPFESASCAQVADDLWRCQVTWQRTCSV